MLRLMPLLGKKISDLSMTDFELIRKVLKIDFEPTEELRVAAIALLKGESIDSVSDLIQSPESVQKLLSFVSSKKEEDSRRIVRCPHCSMFYVER